MSKRPQYRRESENHYTVGEASPLADDFVSSHEDAPERTPLSERIRAREFGWNDVKDAIADEVAALEQERDHLKLAATGWGDTIAVHKAEVERLREYCREPLQRNAALEDEVERLRAAGANAERFRQSQYALEERVLELWYALNKVDNILTIAVTEADEELNERQLRPALAVIERLRTKPEGE